MSFTAQSTTAAANPGTAALRLPSKQPTVPSPGQQEVKSIELAAPSATRDPLSPVNFRKDKATALVLGSKVHLGTALESFIQPLATGQEYAGFKVGGKRQVVVICYDKPTTRHLTDHFEHQATEQQVRLVGPNTNSPPNYFLTEGQEIANAALPKGSDIAILSVPPGRKRSSIPSAELGELLRTMKRKCTHPVLTFQSLSDDDKLMLPTFFDVVFYIDDCEPDFGYSFATMISPGAGTLVASLRRNPVIDNVRIGDDGTLEHSISDCVSPDPMSREIAKLQDQGMTLEEIGVQLGRDKSTISRRIAALPFKPQRRNGWPQ